MRPTRLKSLLPKLAVAAVASLLALGLGELVLRAREGGADLYEGAFLGSGMEHLELRPDRELMWALRPGAWEDRVVNELGLRGPALPAAKGDALRILCVGDSCTFGAGVPESHTYGFRLERQLQQRIGGRVQAVLAAAPGYSTDQNRVQVTRLLPAVRPDLTVLYVGAWNDYVACTGRTDRQRRTTRWAWSRLLARVQEQRDRDAVREAFREGGAPFGPRVPVGEFEDNAAAMVEAARASGSRVLLLIPPLPADTRRRYPQAHEYRAALRRVAAATETALLDADQAFAEVSARLRSERGVENADSLLFDDWVHPSAAGHALLARLLEQAMAPWISRPRVPAEPRDTPRTGDVVRPPLSEGELVLHGDVTGLQRVWVEGVMLRPVPGGDARRWRLPAFVPPGRHRLHFEDGTGEFESTAAEITIEPPRLEVQATTAGAQITVEVSVHGPPAAIVALWVAPRRRAEPVRTDAGRFLLEDLEPWDPGLLAPFLLDALHLYKLPGQIPDGGVWHREFTLPAAALQGRAFFQGLVTTPTSMALTDLVTREF